MLYTYMYVHGTDLASLTVDHSHISVILLQPDVHVVTEWLDQFKRGSIMVIKWIRRNCVVSE